MHGDGFGTEGFVDTVLARRVSWTRFGGELSIFGTVTPVGTVLPRARFWHCFGWGTVLARFRGQGYFLGVLGHGFGTVSVWNGFARF